QHLQVQVHFRTVRDSIEKFSHHLCVQISNPLCCKRSVIVQIRATGQIDSAQNQGLVHRQQEIAVSLDPLLAAESLEDGASKYTACILYRVTAVHIQVSRSLHSQVKEAMTGKTVQHVVEKADAGLYICLSGTVQADGDFYICLFCGSSD